MNLDMNDWQARHSVLSFLGTNVEFEDSRVVFVPPFTCTLNAIKLTEWLEFSESTGYVTQAERDGAVETFRANSFIREPITPEELVEIGAWCLSWEDEIAFCLHYKVRMLTEAEWLVSTYLLPDFDPETTGRGHRGRAIINRFGLNSRIGFAKEEWVSDRIGADAIVRTGPKFYRTRNWREEQNRFTTPIESYRVNRGFRVVICGGQ